MDRIVPRDMDIEVFDAATMDVEVFTALPPDTVAVRPRWWVTTDLTTMDRLTFLPDYSWHNGESIVVGMRAAWQGGDISLSCDPDTGLYFRKGTTEDGTVYGRVFAPCPPPVGLWSGEWADGVPAIDR